MKAMTSTTNSNNFPEWNNVATEYERRVEPFTSSFVQELIAPFHTNDNEQQHKQHKQQYNKKKLLDVGCGSGLGASIAHDAGFHVTACDVSSAMVERVQTRFPDIAATMCVDGQSLPFENEFDFCMGVFSVIFFPNPQAGLEQIRTSLVEGGEVAIAAWGNADETPAFQVFPAAIQSSSSIPNELRETTKPKRITGSVDTLTKLLKDAAYENVHVKGPIERYLQVASPEDYYDRFALTSPNVIKLLDKLDDAQTKELKSKVMELASEKSNREDCISVPASCYFAYGQKPTTTTATTSS